MITVLVVFFPLVISIATGLMSVSPELLELSRACRASKWSELWRIRLPFAIPFIFAGLKVAVSLAVVGAVVGEFVNADAGLGFLIVTSTAFFKVPVAFGALIILSVMGVTLFPDRGDRRARVLPVVEQQHAGGGVAATEERMRRWLRRR